MSEELRAEVERLRAELDKAHKQLTHVDELREQSKQDTENEIDNDWLSAVQNLHWGFEVNLAEGQEIASEGRREVIESIHSELDRVKSEAAALKGALEKCLSTFGHNHWDSTMQHGRGCQLCIEQYEARQHANAALSSTAASDYVSKAEVRPIAEALRGVRLSLNPWQQLVVIQDSGLQILEQALATARKLGLLEDKQ